MDECSVQEANYTLINELLLLLLLRLKMRFLLWPAYDQMKTQYIPFITCV